MMKLFYWIFLGLFAIVLQTCSANTEQGSPEMAPQSTFLEAVQKFNQAFREGDVKALESMITDNYRHSNGNSAAIGKEDWLNYLSKRSQDLASGNLKVLAYSMLEEEVQFYGNTAWLTARVDVQQKRGGVLEEKAYRVSNLWVYEFGAWKRAGFHDGRILP